MSQSSNSLRSARHMSPANLWRERGQSLLSGYKVWRGQNMVLVIIIAASLAHSAQTGSSIVSVMMSWMNMSVEDLWASTCTTSVSYGTNFMYSSSYSYFSGKFLCGGWSSDASHDISIRKSFLISISDSLMSVYSSVTGVVPDGSHRQIKSSLW